MTFIAQSSWFHYSARSQRWAIPIPESESIPKSHQFFVILESESESSYSVMLESESESESESSLFNRLESESKVLLESESESESRLPRNRPSLLGA